MLSRCFTPVIEMSSPSDENSTHKKGGREAAPSPRRFGRRKPHARHLNTMHEACQQRGRTEAPLTRKFATRHLV